MFQGMPYIINVSVDPSMILGVRAEVIILVIAMLTFAVAAAQLIAIYQGLAQMKQASKERDAQLARQAEHLQNQDRENQRRHEQAMAALHKQMDEASEDRNKRHEQAMAALHALIERMSPRPPELSAG